MNKFNYNIVLASKSPRRQQLLKDLGLTFEIRTKEVEEDFSDTLKAQGIPLYLCKKKADEFLNELRPNDLLITADTVVWINDTVLNKPEDEKDAFRMLKMLNGQSHFVYTAVCITTLEKQELFFDETKVTFNNLSDDELRYYIRVHKPFDKAGSYGVQDWLGLCGINKVDGCFYNVMGFPVQKFYMVMREKFGFTITDF